MTTGGQFDRDFLSLLWNVCDATATSDQCETLTKLLEREPRARRLYLQYTALLTDLAEESIGADEVEIPSDSSTAAGDPAVNPSQRSGLPAGDSPTVPGLLQYLRHDPTARLLLPGVVLVLIGYFAAVLGLLVWQHGHPAIPGAPSPQSELGTIVATQNCRWEDAPVAAGDRVSNRTLRLGAGKAELILDGGTRIVLEGPAELALQSGQNAFLRFGRLVAFVPAAAVGFTVETPAARIVDLGTEFVLDVQRTGSTDVHVLGGKVEVARATSADTSSAGVVVSVGQAVRVGSSDHATIEPIPSDAVRFADLRQPIGPQGGRYGGGIVGAGPVPGGRAAKPQRRRDQARSNDLPAIEYFLLGNLFDDPKSASLDAAQLSDTLRAVAGADDLGVNRVALGGLALKEISPGCQFDFSNLGWQDVHYGEVANDTWSRSDLPGEGPEGGIQTLGRKIGRFEPKIEEGIGMHANALVTFDLNEIRAATADGYSGAMYFVCDRCGLNDFVFGQPASVHMLVLTVDGRGQPLVAWLDGAPAEIAVGERGLAVISPVGRPLTADGKFVGCRVPLPIEACFLTLVVTSAGDGYTYDGAVWSGARLERPAPGERDRPLPASTR